MDLTSFIYVALAAVVVFVLSIAYLIIRRRIAEQKIRIAEERAKRILDEAKTEAETKKKEAVLEASIQGA